MPAISSSVARYTGSRLYGLVATILRTSASEVFTSIADRRVRAQRHAGQGDADLGGGDVAGEALLVLDDRQQPGGRGVPVLAEPPQPAAAHADRPELGGHVKGRQPDEQQDDSCGEKHPAIL